MNATFQQNTNIGNVSPSIYAPGMVSFLIVNYNGGRMLAECLESIRHQTYRNYEVIVVDNGSTDNSWNISSFDDTRWRIVRLTHNSGFSPANNLALAESRGEFLALVNNDITLARDWAANMVKAISAESGIGSAACIILQRNHPDRIDSAGITYYSCGTVTAWRDCPYHGFDISSHKPFGAVASAALYRRSALEKVGLFHDRYFAYYEDTDLAIRLVLYGYGCAFSADSIAYHYGSATGVSRSYFHIFHLRRNVEYVYWINMVGGMAFRYLLPHLIYELFAFIGALRDRRIKAFILAKGSFLKNIGWVIKERKALRLRLISSVGVVSAQVRLSARMAPWQNALGVRWGEGRSKR